MKKINIKKQLKPIKEENYDKKRPQSAKNIHNVISTGDTDKYTSLDYKHKDIKKRINKNNLNNTQTLSSGGFNKLFKVNDKIGLRVPLAGTKAFNKDFNTIFVSTLLDICGEKTIDSGKGQDGTYFDLGKNNLFDETKEVFRNHYIKFSPHFFKILCDNKTYFNDKLQPNEQTTIKAFLIMYIFATDELSQDKRTVTVEKDILQKIDLNEQDLTFMSRVLCKVFLLQMFDRKPENTVVFEDKDGKIDFCEIDFDDNQYENDFTSNIFFQLISSDDARKEDIKKRWNDKLRVLINYYRELVKNAPSLEESFKKMIKNYTMTTEKIEELIKKTALKAKYMGLNEQKVIDDINAKIELWKEMLKDEENGKIVNEISGVKEARKKTLTALRQINKENVENIVKDVMFFHDYSYNNPKSKDDNDIIGKEHKKINEDIASKTGKMIEAEKSRMQKQASFISRFVADGMEIQPKDITAENLISYFKLEKDRSRTFFWFFGQRNKRFNALCRELEKRWKENSNNDIRIDDRFLSDKNNMERDENLIRSLFPVEQQQGNNQRRAITNTIPQHNTQELIGKIADRLNQVGCCSFG